MNTWPGVRSLQLVITVIQLAQGLFNMVLLSVNPFIPNTPFLCPQKTSENRMETNGLTETEDLQETKFTIFSIHCDHIPSNHNGYILDFGTS